MELFLLLAGRRGNRPDIPENVRREFFDPDCTVRDEGSYRLIVNRKTLAASCVNYTGHDGSASGTGTFTYRCGNPEESLRSLVSDFREGRYDPACLLGHYFIFLFLPDGFSILTDGTGLVKAWHDGDGSFLTSSFLLAARLTESRVLNREAATENLVTGGITGAETLLRGISVFSRASARLFSGIRFVIPATGEPGRSPASAGEAAGSQAALLTGYFRSWSRLTGKSGPDIGLTGGYDSRLVLACAIDSFNDLQVHSHHRPAGSEELRIARMIAEGEGLGLVSPQVIPPEDMDDPMLERVLESSFRFNDGNISLHCNWMEEYNTAEYRMTVLGDRRLGMSGIGGEQYRNQDRLCIKPWFFRQWLKYSCLRRVSGKAFTSARDEELILDRMRSKISEVLGFSSGKVFIDIYDLKRIQNEVQIPAYRGARTDAENRLSWYLSPLADVHIASAAYGITRFLKDSKRFEGDLIKLISPALAAYPTDYGYDLLRGEPVSARITGSSFENLLPASVKWALRERARRGDRAVRALDRIRTSPVLAGYIQNVTDAGLPVSVPALLARESTAHMVVALGYFLDKIKPSTGS